MARRNKPTNDGGDQVSDDQNQANQDEAQEQADKDVAVQDQDLTGASAAAKNAAQQATENADGAHKGDPQVDSPEVHNDLGVQGQTPAVGWADQEGTGPDTSRMSPDEKNAVQAQTEADGHKGDTPPDAVGLMSGPTQGDPVVQNSGEIVSQTQLNREKLSQITDPAHALPIIRTKVSELHNLIHNIGNVLEVPAHAVESLIAEIQYLFGVVRTAR